MSEIPELRPNQFGVTVKVYEKKVVQYKPVDKTIYFTVNKNNLSMEFYPEDPIIVIDKDIAIAILKKIAEVDKS